MHPFQEFQFAFARHIRDPRSSARPAGVPARRMSIYNELLFNNFEGFLLACFPVTRDLLGDRRWSKLTRTFFRDARCHTPYFREIPREFVRWLGEDVAHGLSLQSWLPELVHYEWVELAVDTMDAESADFDPDGSLLEGIPVPAAALMNLAYSWPVHRISPDWRPRKPKPANLVVYRDATQCVRFMELNTVAARLMALIQAGGKNGREACLAIATELAHPHPDAVVAHGAVLLEELRAAGAVLGTAR